MTKKIRRSNGNHDHFYEGWWKNKIMKSSKIEEQLKRTEARLQKTKEEKKALQVKKKKLAQQAENERLISRGKILGKPDGPRKR